MSIVDFPHGMPPQLMEFITHIGECHYRANDRPKYRPPAKRHSADAAHKLWVGSPRYYISVEVTDKRKPITLPPIPPRNSVNYDA